jgi:hypothetical protein
MRTRNISDLIQLLLGQYRWLGTFTGKQVPYEDASGNVDVPSSSLEEPHDYANISDDLPWNLKILMMD